MRHILRSHEGISAPAYLAGPEVEGTSRGAMIANVMSSLRAVEMSGSTRQDLLGIRLFRPITLLVVIALGVSPMSYPRDASQWRGLVAMPHATHSAPRTSDDTCTRRSVLCTTNPSNHVHTCTLFIWASFHYRFSSPLPSLISYTHLWDL